jgi:hypothetical protein
MVALKGYEKHHNDVVVCIELLYIPLSTMLFRYFLDFTLVNELY